MIKEDSAVELADRLISVCTGYMEEIEVDSESSMVMIMTAVTQAIISLGSSFDLSLDLIEEGFASCVDLYRKRDETLQ